MMKISSKFYGMLLCIILALISQVLKNIIPIGSISIVIILGIIVNHFLLNNCKIKNINVLKIGINYSEKNILSIAIALLGINLNFNILEKLGINSIILIILSMIFTICSSIALSRFFKINISLGLLLGIGNGVCGSSAIASTKDIIGSNKSEVAISIAIVNFLGTIGIFLLPVLSNYILHLSQIQAGLLIGNTLQAVGHVIAATFSVGEQSGQIAIVVKMTRILMLFPLIIVLLFKFNKKTNINKKFSFPKVPPFIIGFIFFSAISSLNILPQTMINIIKLISHLLLTVAMAAIGLNISLKGIFKEGITAFKMSLVIFILQIIFSSTVIFFYF